MANLEEISDENVAADNIPEIPDGLPGSKNPRRNPFQRQQFDKPEEIKIPRRRGRPPGSGNIRSKNSNSIPTSTQKMWEEGAAIILGSASTIFALQVMRSQKYIMRESEAKAAAAGLVYCLFQYKQIREFALATKLDTPWAIALKGFWPYLSRVFVEDIINYVILGFTKPGQSKSGQSTRSNNNGSTQSSGSNNGNDNAADGYKFPDAIIIRPDWRNGD